MSENWEKIAEGLKNTDFLKDFLEIYIRNGFGSLPKREVDLHLIHLIKKHHPDWETISDYSIARQLKLSPRKVRNFLDEVAYKDPALSDDWCKEQLISILKDAERLKQGNLLHLQIENGLVRDFAAQKVRSAGGVVEYGTNSQILKLSAAQYLELSMAILDEAQIQKIQDELEDLIPPEENRPLLRLFAEKFMEGAGSKAGEEAIKIGKLLITGGIDDGIEIIKGFLRSPNGEE